jgi:hypothetical protein
MRICKKLVTKKSTIEPIAKFPLRDSGESRKTKFNDHKAKLNVHNPVFSVLSGPRLYEHEASLSPGRRNNLVLQLALLINDRNIQLFDDSFSSNERQGSFL